MIPRFATGSSTLHGQPHAVPPTAHLHLPTLTAVRPSVTKQAGPRHPRIVSSLHSALHQLLRPPEVPTSGPAHLRLLSLRSSSPSILPFYGAASNHMSSEELNASMEPSRADEWVRFRCLCANLFSNTQCADEANVPTNADKSTYWTASQPISISRGVVTNSHAVLLVVASCRCLRTRRDRDDHG